MGTHWGKMCIQSIERRKLRGSRPRSFQEKGDGEPSTERKEGYGLAETSHSSHLANQQILPIQGAVPEANHHSLSYRQGKCETAPGPLRSDQRTECPTLVQGDLFKGAEERNFVKTIRVLSNSPPFFFFFLFHCELFSCPSEHLSVWAHRLAFPTSGSGFTYAPQFSLPKPPTALLCSFPTAPLPNHPKRQTKINKQICETSYLEWFKSLYTIKTLSNDWLLSRWLSSLLNSSISEQCALSPALSLPPSLSPSPLVEFCQVPAALLEGAMPN